MVEFWGLILISGSYDVVLDVNNNGLIDLGVVGSLVSSIFE